MSIKIWDKTPLIITKLYYSDNANTFANNHFYVLREDLIPFSFGGNKTRKALNYFEEIINNGYDTVITYGSLSSNHTRIIANFSCKLNLKSIIITPENPGGSSFNHNLVEYLDARIIICPLDKVKETIIKTIDSETTSGRKPYFIQGGGHGNLGTSAYVDVFKQLLNYEEQEGIIYDYIFLASGTGTTQAGLIIGNLVSNAKKKIVGISVARSKLRGTEIIKDSLLDFVKYNKLNISVKKEDLIFDDSYIVNGYGTFNSSIESIIENQFKTNGLPLDPTYTGKAFWGMQEFIKKHNIQNKNILFIHTGGTPLFFDYFMKRDRLI